MDFNSISSRSLSVYKLIGKYDIENPIVTKFNEKAFFMPDKRQIERDGICEAWVKYVTHFITGNKPRSYDKSKFEAIGLIIPSLLNADSRYEQINEDNSKTIHYLKTLEGNKNFCLTLKVDLEEEGLIRAITILPNQKSSQVQKKIAEGIWLPSTIYIPLSDTSSFDTENPPIENNENTLNEVGQSAFVKALANIRLFLNNDSSVNENIYKNSIEIICNTMSKDNILIGDAYFEANPNHILGDPYEKARGDRGGKIEHMVKGTLQSAVEMFNALYGFGYENALRKKQESIPADLKAISKANPNIIIATMPKKVENPKKVIENVIAKAETDRKKAVVTAKASENSKGAIAETLMYSAAENYDTLNPGITTEELSAFLYANPDSHIWKFKQPTITEEECFKRGLLMLDIPSYLSLGNIKTVYVYEYLSGNVFKKMNAVQNAILNNWPNLEANNNKYFTLSQLEFQLSKMQSILPPFKKIDAVNEDDRIIILPHADLCKKLKITQLKNGRTVNGSLYEQFLIYVNYSLRSSQITNGALLDDVKKYVANKSIRLSEYDKNGISEDQQTELKQAKQRKAKEAGDELFYKYIEDFISQNDIAILNQEWNAKFNGTVEPILAKIPVSFPFSKVFKGGSKLALTTTQRNGVAFSYLNKSSLLGYDVGVGKTLTLIACLSNQFATGTTKRALLVVPDATFKKWIFEIKGGEKNNKWEYGALPTAKVFAFGNLNIDVIENEVREYSETERRFIDFLKYALNKAKYFRKLYETKVFNEDAFAKPLKELLDALIKSKSALSEYYVNEVLSETKVKTILSQKNDVSYVDYYTSLLLDATKQELELAIYTLGKVKAIPEGSIVMLNYTGLVRLGFSENSREKLRSGLYKILSQGEVDAKNEASLVKKIDEIIGTTGLNAKINIDDLQIDHLAIDEAHNMKKVFTRVKGEVKPGEETDDKGMVKREMSQYALDSGEPSNQAICAFCMSQYVQQIAKGNNTILTATPFTNNPLEVFSMLALTNYRRLVEEGKDNMLDFFNTYIKEELQLVINAKGMPEYKPVVTGFNNLPQLRQMIFDIIDYKTGEDANVMRPEAISIPDVSSIKKWGGASSVLELSSLQKAYMKKIENYINNDDVTVFDVCDDALESDVCELTKEYIKNLEKAKSDLMDEAESTKILRALSWQKLLAVSPYLFACNDLGCPTYKEYIEESPKLLYTIKCIESSKKWHEARKESVSGSVIYMSAGTRYFGLIKEYLVKQVGFKPNEVEIINGEVSKEKKEAIKEKFLIGEIKVIIGSSTIKEGIDLQNCATSLYIIIPDWNPTDYNQVKGRIWRQGNMFSYVRIVNVLMANTADIFIYQKLQEKTQRIKELLDRTSTKSQLDLDDVNPEEIKESLITDPKRKAQIQIKRQSREIDAQITVVNNQLVRLTELQSSTITFNNLHPKVVASVNEFNQKYAQILKERDIEEDFSKRLNHEAKGIKEPFVSKLDLNAEVYIPVIFDEKDYSENNMNAISRRATSMMQRVRDNEVVISGFNYYVLQELVSNWRDVRPRFIKGLETLASMGFNNEQLNEGIEANKLKIEALKAENQSFYSQEYLDALTEKNRLEIESRANSILSLDDCVAQFEALNKYMEFKADLPKITTEVKVEPIVEKTIEKKSSISEVTKIKFKIETLQETLEDKTITKELKRKVEFKLETLLEYLEEMKAVA
jgi:hypothetical protein